MKRTILFLALILSSLGAFAQSYDFSDVSPSGQTLYYNIIDGNAEVTSQNQSYPYYSTYPTGAIEIPSSVTYNDTTYSVTNIGNNAFCYCSGLYSITIPNSVTTIGAGAFSSCDNLTSVTIGNSVTSIGNYAFEGCSGLTSIDIPNSVTSIGWGAFEYCSGLTSVVIPNSVTSMGSGVFLRCSSLASVTISDSVTSIGDYAFNMCSGLTSVTIPNSVTSIGQQAFYGCSGLTSLVVTSGNTVYDSRDNCNAIIETETNTLIAGCKNTTIPNSVTSIGEYAFFSCSGLTSVTIPNSVTSIGNSAFYGCSSLTSVTIGNSVTSIGNSAFSYCSSLTSIDIPNSVTSIGDNAFGGCYGLTSVTIGNSVTSIGNYAFSYCSGLTSVTIPNSVTSIGEYTFDGCYGLTSVTIGNSVTSIGSSAFSGCNHVDTLYYNARNLTMNPWSISPRDGFLPMKLKHLVIGDSVQTLPNFGFYNQDSLTGITIPNSVTSIGNSVFSGCSGLTSVYIPNSVTSIGELTFYGCNGLTSVTIGNSVTTIGGSAFYGCNHVDTLYYNARNLTNTNSWYSSRDGFCPMKLKYLVIGDSVQSLPDYIFHYQDSLTNVTIPNSITSIGYAAFYGCNHVDTLYYNARNLTNTNSWYSSRDGFCLMKLKYLVIGDSVQSLPDYIFYNQDSLTGITIPNSVTSIGEGAFYGCSGLTSVTIPNSVTTIGNWAFYRVGVVRYCGSATGSPWGGTRVGCIYGEGDFIFEDDTKTTILAYIGTGASVSIPNSVTAIGDMAFYNCSTLTSVTIPNSVTTIGGMAFYGCRGLTTITIPDSVTTIGYDAFYGCSGLTSVTIGNSMTAIGYAAFYGCNHVDTLYYNARNLTTTVDWGVYGESYNSYGFRPMKIKYLVIGDSVQSLPDYVFCFQDSLTYMTIGNSVDSIGEYAFSNCSRLTSITIPNSVTTIGDIAFQGCSSLTCISIGNLVTFIGNGAFYGCSNVDTLYYNARNLTTTSDWYNSSSYGFRSMRLNHLVIGDSVQTLPAGVFYGQSSLTSITIPNSVTSIGDYVFYNCSGLTSVTIPNSVTSIGSSAFYECSGLTSVTIGNSVTSIGNYSFYNCSALTSAFIPNSVTYIGDDAFRECNNLADITIPDSVTFIGDRAFCNCSNFDSVFIPSSVTNIGTSAFSGCSSLESMSVDARNTYYDSRDSCNAIVETRTNTLIAGCKNTTIPNSVNTIGSEAFYYCNGLTGVTIPNSVTSIAGGAFAGCSGLMSVTIPNSVTSIEISAFYNCSNLTSVTIPSSLSSIAGHLFYGCSQLTSVNISGTVFSIGDSAFYGCTSLTSVVIPNSVDSIGDDAFTGCDSLRTVYDVSDIDRGISVGGTANGHVAEHADRVVTISSEGISGEGSNSIYQIPEDYYSDDNQSPDPNNIPEDDIPDNFIYHENSNAKTATEWKAKNIVLSDGKDAFNTPVAFNAENVTYTRSYEQGNRSTICLPFKPTTVNGQPTTNLKFYAFAGFDGSTITFNEVAFANLQANTPYMVEWPESKVDQDFVFGATGSVAIPATGDAASRTVTRGNGKFIGTMSRTCMDGTNYYGYKNGYFVQSAGGQEENAHAHVNPFRAYFQITPSNAQGFAMPTELSVRFNTAEDNVGIDSVEPQQSNIRYSNDVYDMMGRLVRKNAESLEGLRKGVYIWKGEKKVVF